MITKKGFNVYVAVFVIGSLNVCFGCFSENFTGHVEPIKTGESVLKICRCEKEGYTVQNIKWFDPHGHEIQALSTNVVETVYTRPVSADTKEKLRVVEVNTELEPGTDSNVYTSVIANESYVSLNIKSMSKSLSGTYTCETNFEGVKYTKAFTFDAHDSLYFVNTNATQHVILGEDSLIRCEIRGNSEKIIIWQLRSETSEIPINSDDKYNITSNGLVVKNVSKDDGGIYICRAINVAMAEFVDKNITVQVTARPYISELKPEPGTTVLAGTNLSVQCVAEGIPHPDYVWTKITDWRGKPMKEYNTTWRTEVNTMIFDNIQKEDAGTYSCMTTNYVGSDAGNITIEVKVPPEIIHFENVSATEGSVVTMTCVAIGESPPRIFITYNTEEDFDNNSISYSDEPVDGGTRFTVTFNNVSRYHEGVYSCNASNEVDYAVKDVYFSVFYKPVFDNPAETLWGWDGNTANMSCEHRSNPPAKIVWKFQGLEIGQETTAQQVEANRFIVRLLNNASDHYMAIPIDKNTIYGVYACTATNEYGAATKFIHLARARPPGPVKNVMATNKTATSITFHIEGPDFVNGPPVLGYVAQYDTIDNFNVTKIHLNRTWSLDRKFILEGLKRNTTYLMSFAARNEAGVGDWSEIYEFDTPETSAPEPPEWDASPPGKLSWKVPEANGTPIDYYILEYCPFVGRTINHTLCKVENLTATEFSLGNLDENSTYSFKISAHNAHGFSEFREKEVITPEKPLLTVGGIIGLSVVAVFLCLLVLDLLLLSWRRQGIIASCCLKRSKKKKDDDLQSRDKKGLLGREGEARPDGSLTSPNNGHRQFEYNKTTGVITGKHSTV